MQTTEDLVGAVSANGATPPVSSAPPVPPISDQVNDEIAQHLNGDAHTDANGLAELLHAMQAMRVGDFSVRMAGDRVGIIGKIADTFNEIVATNQRMARQLERVGQVVGRDGRTRQRVRFGLSTAPGARWNRASIR